MTLPRTSVTDCSSLTGCSVTPARPATVTAAAPQGTSGAQSTRLSPLRPRSAKVLTCAGLSGGTAISSRFVAKGTGFTARSSATSVSMVEVSAEAKTSAGAPCWICATRSEEPPKLNATLTPLCAASNFLPMSVNVCVNDAAAYTVSVCGLLLLLAEPLFESDPDPQAAVGDAISRKAA